MIENEKKLYHTHRLEVKIKEIESELKEKELRLQRTLDNEKQSIETASEIKGLIERIARLEKNFRYE